jgi:methyl-accepting chemotaxis protein
MKLDNIRIRTQLWTGFGLVMALLIACVCVGMWRLDNLNRIAQALGGDEAEKAAIAMEWRAITEKNLLRANVILRISEKKFAAELRDDITKGSAKNSEYVKRMQDMVHSEDGKAALAEVMAARTAYNSMRDDLIKQKMAGKDVLSQLDARLMPLSNAYAAAMTKLVDLQNKRVADFREAAADATRQGAIVLVSGSLIALVLSILTAWLIARSITRSVDDAKSVADAIAAGDLTREIDVRGTNELGQLMGSLQAMTASLRGLVTDVRGAVDSVATASSQIAQGNQDLSARTESQASSLQQTAASMEQLTSTVKQSADNARQAQQLAATASEVAAKGGAVVGEVVVTMDGITEASKKINDIIGVIDGIAFQTNILALNAAVEAARAGEQGRGFAVVAGEVRTLAQRSAQAAKEIKTLIGDSVARVDNGTQLVANAGTTMDEIVSQVKRVTDLIGEITAATIEQSGGIEQVNTAVVSLDQTTQQNAALVEQSAAAAASLKDQATKLSEAVSVFKVDQTRASAAPAASQKPISSLPATVSVRKLGGKPAPAVPQAKPALPEASPPSAPPKVVAGGNRSGEDEWEEF